MKKLSSDGIIVANKKQLPMSSWEVCIEDHHEGYITWKDYFKNQQMLEKNRPLTREQIFGLSTAREGAALLQGLLLCKKCGHRLSVKYNGSAALYPFQYICKWRQKELFDKICIKIEGAPFLDEAITQRVLEAIKPAEIEIALKAWEDLVHREEEIDKQWKMKMDRVKYEAHLAQRSYEEVDPSNRLVASTLEKRWNDALEQLELIQKEYEEVQQKSVLQLTEDKKQHLFSMAKDLPKLWKAPTTPAKEKKRILRLLIKDITVEKINPDDEGREIILHIRWQGGATESLKIDKIPPITRFSKTSQEIIDLIRNLSLEHIDEKIVDILNERGLKTGVEKDFSLTSVQWIRARNGIPSYRTIKYSNEMTVKEVSEKFNVNAEVVYSWIKRNLVKNRQPTKGDSFWITIDEETEAVLTTWIQNSKRIPKAY